MKKRFDAVRFQRKIREELSREYLKDREVFIKGLKKYRTTKKARLIRTSDNTVRA